MPWAVIPFLLLLTLSVKLRGAMGWDVETLIIPVSAWIGYRYGSAGVKAVCYASIPLIVFRFRTGIDEFIVGFGADGGMLLAALAFAWLLSSPKNPAALLSYLGEKKHHLWWLLVLPFAYYAPRIPGFAFRLNGFLSVNAAFFILGLVLPREDFRRLWKVGGAMFALGIGVYFLPALMGMRNLNFPFGRLAYLFFAPQDVISVVTFLFAGYWCRGYVEDGTLPKGVIWGGAPMLLIVLMIFGYLRSGIRPEFGSSIPLTGDVYVSILSCFLAGLFYRKRGFLIVLAPAFILIVGWWVFVEMGGGRGIQFADFRVYISTTSVAQAATNLVSFFLWTCAGSQLAAFMADKPVADAASGAPARAGA